MPVRPVVLPMPVTPPGMTSRQGGCPGSKISTRRTYATYLPRWTAWCAGRGIDPQAARRADIERWLRSVADSGLSRASVAAHHDAVASIHRLAPDEDLIDHNPCARIPRPQVHRELQRREVLTVLEYAGYLTAAR